MKSSTKHPSISKKSQGKRKSYKALLVALDKDDNIALIRRDKDNLLVLPGCFISGPTVSLESIGEKFKKRYEISNLIYERISVYSLPRFIHCVYLAKLPTDYTPVNGIELIPLSQRTADTVSPLVQQIVSNALFAQSENVIFLTHLSKK